MTNFVIVCDLPPVAQPQVLHSNADSALEVLSVPYSKLYHFSLSEKLVRDTTMHLGERQDFVVQFIRCVLPQQKIWETLVSQAGVLAFAYLGLHCQRLNIHHSHLAHMLWQGILLCIKN